MSEVKLKVGGRVYTVAVADGQEDALRTLAGKVDAKIAGMGQKVSINEAKNLLFAAILLADELEEANKAKASSAVPAFDTDGLADRLERMAQSLENTAQSLEGGH